MSILEIKRLTDWKRALNTRSVYAVTDGPHPLKIVGVGRKYIRVISEGRMKNVDPATIKSIQGL